MVMMFGDFATKHSHTLYTDADDDFDDGLFFLSLLAMLTICAITVCACVYGYSLW